MAGIVDENMGLMSGLAQGVQGFLGAYNQTKQRNLENEWRKQQMALELKKAGYAPDESGNLMETPEHQTSREIEETSKRAPLMSQYQMEGNKIAVGDDNQPILSPRAEQDRQLGLMGKKAGFMEKGIDYGDQGGLGGVPTPRQYVTPEQQAKLDEADKKFKASNNLASQRMDISRQGLDIRRANAENMRETRGERVQMTGNQQYAQNMKTTEAALLSANKAAALTEGIANGTLKSTKQLSSDLSANIASLISGGRPATVFGMSHQDFDSAYKRVQNAYAMISGQTPNTMTNAQLKQLSLDIRALQSEYGKQHEAAYKSFSANMPENLKPGLDSRYHTFRQQTGLEQPAQAPQQGLMGQGPQSFEPDVLNYAQKHGISPQEAQQIKIKRTSGQ